MAIRMHLYVFFIFLLLQIVITLVVTYFLQGQRYAAVGRYLLDLAKISQAPDMNIVWPYLTYLSWNLVCVFVASSVIYFGYPFAIALFKGRSRRQLETKHLAGAGLVSVKEFARQIEKGDLPFGSFRLPVREETKHCLTIGRPGTGKTVFLSQVVERLIERKAKGAIYDFKGDHASRSSLALN